MLEYLKTAGQTAKKNGCTLINNKLVADFSAVKKFLDDSATELDKIGLTVEEVFKGFADAAAETFNTSSFIFSEYSCFNFFAGKYLIYADLIGERTAVYNNGKRKYNIIKPVATRLNIGDNNTDILLLEYHGRYYTTHIPVIDVEV